MLTFAIATFASLSSGSAVRIPDDYLFKCDNIAGYEERMACLSTDFAKLQAIHAEMMAVEKAAAAPAPAPAPAEPTPAEDSV